MALLHRKPLHERGGERGGERIAGADRVGHLDAGRSEVRRAAVGGRHTAAPATLGEDDVTERKALDELRDNPLRSTFQPEETGHDGEFVLVEFQDVGPFERVADDPFVVIVQAQVDVEQPQTPDRRGVDERENRAARHGVALRQRTPADHGGAGHGGIGLRRAFDVVPRHLLADAVGGNARCVERHLDRTRGMRVALHGTHAESQRGDAAEQFVARSILPYGAHDARLGTLLLRIEGEVDGRAAEPPPGRQHVPQQLSDTDDLRLSHLPDRSAPSYKFRGWRR